MDKTTTYRCRSTYGLMVIYLQMTQGYSLNQIAQLIDEPIESIRAAKIADFVPSTLKAEIKLIKLFNSTLRANNKTS